MSYRAGTAGLSGLGIADSAPRIICDGCGYTLRVGMYGVPPVWFLDGKAPPKWRKVQRTADGGRVDYCPACKGNREEEGR